MPDPELREAEAGEYFNRGCVSMSSKQHYEAIADFKMAIELNPKVACTYNNCGLCHYKLGKYDLAIEYYELALKLKPFPPTTYHNFDTTFNAINHNCGNAYSAIGKYDKAIEYFKNAIVHNPHNASAHGGCGFCYYKLKQYNQAIVYYKKAIALQPHTNADNYSICGLCYYSLGQYNLAIACYEELLKLEPDFAEAYNERGICYYNLSQYDQAIADFNKVIKLCSKRGFPHNNLGNVYYKTRDYCKALNYFTRAADLEPKLDYSQYDINIPNYLIPTIGIESILETEMPEILEKLDKLKIINAIKKISANKQIELLMKCLNSNTAIGAKMWEQEKGFFAKPCDPSTGIFKLIIDYLIKDLHVAESEVRECIVRPPISASSYHNNTLFSESIDPVINHYKVYQEKFLQEDYFWAIQAFINAIEAIGKDKDLKKDYPFLLTAKKDVFEAMRRLDKNGENFLEQAKNNRKITALSKLYWTPNDKLDCSLSSGVLKEIDIQLNAIQTAKRINASLNN